MKTQPMPTRERLTRIAEGVQTWAAGKIADHNARRALERDTYRIQGWTVIES